LATWRHRICICVCVHAGGRHFGHMLAHISGEVGTLCTVLIIVYTRTCVPIFIEIGSYLTDTKQKNRLARPLRHDVQS